MEFRRLGASGFKVPVLSLGTATFGGKGVCEGFGSTDVKHARRMVDMCIEAGVNMFDSADIYSDGVAESLLGEAIKGRRNEVIVSTKATFRFGDGANDVGSSRYHLIEACDAALKRFGTDYIDVLYMHCADANTPIEETLSALDDLIRSGKVRYIGASNLSGWQLMKSLSVSERRSLQRYVANQAYYSLIGRDFEWELMPLGLDQGIGTAVWSVLGWGRLTGKIRRDKPLPEVSRLHSMAEYGPPMDNEHLYRVIDAMDEVAEETGKSISQIAINWVLQRPTVATVIIGARNEQQLQQNLGAVGWNLTAEQMKKLDTASATAPVYPYWVQRNYPEINPPLV